MGDKMDTKNLNSRLAAAREAQRSQDLAWEEKQEVLRRGFSSKAFRPALREDYQQWLAGYLERGGEITHVYDYPWHRWRWYVAFESAEIFPLYGSSSINIIVPQGIELTGDPGHSTIFWMDGFRASSIVPIFSDISF